MPVDCCPVAIGAAWQERVAAYPGRDHRHGLHPAGAPARNAADAEFLLREASKDRTSLFQSHAAQPTVKRFAVGYGGFSFVKSCKLRTSYDCGGLHHRINADPPIAFVYILRGFSLTRMAIGDQITTRSSGMTSAEYPAPSIPTPPPPPNTSFPTLSSSCL